MLNLDTFLEGFIFSFSRIDLHLGCRQTHTFLCKQSRRRSWRRLVFIFEMMGGGRLVDAKKVEGEVEDSDSLDWIGWITTSGFFFCFF
jgi:hypothetical protein